MKISPAPYTIIVIGSFSPYPREEFRTKIVPVDSPNEALSVLRPMLWIPLPKELCPDAGIPVGPERMKDLTPDGLVQSVKFLKDLDEARSFVTRMSAAAPAGIAEAIHRKWPGLPLDLSYQTSPGKPAGQTRVDDILSMVALGGGAEIPAPKNDAVGPKAWVAAIDRLLSEIMTIIFSDRAFRDLERLWRGIDLVAKQGPAGTSKDTRLAIVDAAFDNLPDVLRDLAAQCETDPPGLVVIAMNFDNSPVSMGCLGSVASFAENLLVPTVIDISPNFLGMANWAGIDHLPYLAHHIDDNPVYAAWTKLRSLPEGNWLCGACNPFLVRSMYEKEEAGQNISFDEPEPLYISPVFAVAALAARSVALCGWPSRLTDTGNICIEGLGLHSINDGSQASTEIVLSVDRLRQAGEIGLTPVTGVSMRDVAFCRERGSFRVNPSPLRCCFRE
jgi:hypothetical protein